MTRRASSPTPVLAAALALSIPLLADPSIAATVGPTVTSLLDDLPYDENGKLETHLLVYPENCATTVALEFRHEHYYGRVLRPVAGPAQDAYFSDTVHASPRRIEDCRMACVDRGVDKSVVQYTMPEKHYDPAEFKMARDFLRERCEKVEFGFLSYHDRPVDLYWIRPADGERILNRKLEYGERKTQFISTFLGHRFVAEDEETKEVLLDMTVEYTGIIGIGDYKTMIQERHVEDEVRRTHMSEWNRHNRVKRTFSELGFKKGRLPNDLWASIGAYYYNNRDHKVREEWPGKGLFVNWWETDCFFIQIPWELKTKWQTRLRAMVEDWTQTELENTDIYGMRQYEPGARLLTHVDRESTHAASLIINVAQGNVTSPWAVEVHDHADRLHEVTMEPGDVVYYESAKCLHGRNTPLQGGYYVNLFSHFRPKGDPRWYVQPNPAGTPEPLMDVGECRLEGTLDQVGVGAVKCDDPAIGPYLSPTMFRARSAEDLSEWWLSVRNGRVGVDTPAVPSEEGDGESHEEL